MATLRVLLISPLESDTRVDRGQVHFLTHNVAERLSPACDPLNAFHAESESDPVFWVVTRIFIVLDFSNMLVHPFSYHQVNLETVVFRNIIRWRAGSPWIYAFTVANLARRACLLLMAGLLIAKPSARTTRNNDEGTSFNEVPVLINHWV